MPRMRDFSGLVDYMQCFAPDSLANLVKSLVKHRGRVFRRKTLRNFGREEFFSSAFEDLRLSFSRSPSFTPSKMAGAMSSAVKR
jgi:hypothetical protein